MAKKLAEVFSPEDIKSGYVVKLRNGTSRLVMRAGRFTKVLVGGSITTNWEYLSYYDNELKYKKYKNFFRGNGSRGISRRDDSKDIMEVYGLINDSNFYYQANTIATENRDLLWTRTPTVEMTLEEVCQKLGHNVKIVKEKE